MDGEPEIQGSDVIPMQALLLLLFLFLFFFFIFFSWNVGLIYNIIPVGIHYFYFTITWLS